MIPNIKAHYEMIFASEEYARRFHPGADDPKRRKRKPPAPGGLLDIPAAAAKLNVTVEQLRAFVRSGALKCINMGNGTKRARYRFEDSDLQEFIDGRKSRETPCLSTRLQSPNRITGSISKSVVVGFMAAREARLAKKPKG
jgi:hypothetical protein